jgi:hypothetical protein
VNELVSLTPLVYLLLLSRFDPRQELASLFDLKDVACCGGWCVVFASDEPVRFQF